VLQKFMMCFISVLVSHCHALLHHQPLLLSLLYCLCAVPLPYTGLLAFLRLLGSWPWAAAPLLVDPGWPCNKPHTVIHLTLSLLLLSSCTGLLAFLRLLGSWPWSAAPLLVDPGREVGPEERRALHREYGARAAAGAAPAMFLATPRDLHASRW
jgi:hypothetical protein